MKISSTSYEAYVQECSDSYRFKMKEKEVVGKIHPWYCH